MSQPDLTMLGRLEQEVQSNSDQQEICPRCRHTAVTRSDAPDQSGAWSVNTCGHCCFSWRSTEDAMHALETAEGTTYRLWDSEIEKLPMPVPFPVTSR
jgi:ribosomal protein L37AE/L43A